MQWYVLPYEVKTLSPVLMSSDIGDPNIVRTVDYIKGTAVLGLFASRYIKDQRLSDAHKDPTFNSWFLQGNIGFSNAYLKISDAKAQAQCLPSPLCLMVKKTDEQMVYNIAVRQVKDANRSVGGYCDLTGSRIRVVSPRKVLNFHHIRANNRIKGHSDDGGIFNYEALDKDQIFGGLLTGTKEALTQFREHFGSTVRAQIGRSKNTQYGSVEFFFGEVAEYELADQSTVKVGDKEVTLSFTSPVLLRNTSGLPEVSTPIMVQYLQKAGLANFEVAKSFVKSVTVENFVSVWKAKRPAELGLAAGSTYVLTFAQGLTMDDVTALQAIVRCGIGERLNEGFGRVRLNWPMQDIYTKESVESKMVSRPVGDPPSLTKQIFNDIVISRLQEIMLAKALEEADSFDKALTNSMLGNLESLLEHESIEVFHDRIKTKRDLRDALDNCVQKQGHRSLLERLTVDKVPDLAGLIRSENSVQMLAKSIGLDRAADNEFSTKIYKDYWRTVFQNMRKLNKKAQREGARTDGR